MKVKEFLANYNPINGAPLLLNYVLVAIRDTKDRNRYPSGLHLEVICFRVRYLMKCMKDRNRFFIRLDLKVQQALDYGRNCQIIVRHNNIQSYYLARKRNDWTPVRRINFEEAPDPIGLVVGLRLGRTCNEQEYGQLVREYLPREFVNIYLP